MRDRHSSHAPILLIAIMGVLGLVAVLAPWAVRGSGSAEDAALRAIVQDAGTDCLQGADVLISPDGLLAAMKSKGIERGWIDRNFSWVGSEAELADELGGPILGRDEEGIWMKVGTGSEVRAVQFRPISLADGHVVWAMTSSVTAVEASAC